MAHTFTSLLCHLIFSTKDRQPFLDAEVRPRLFGYMGGILREEGATALIINGLEDHVHALVATPPTRALSDVMRVLKTNSSRWGTRAVAWEEGVRVAGGLRRVQREQVERR